MIFFKETTKNIDVTLTTLVINSNLMNLLYLIFDIMSKSGKKERMNTLFNDKSLVT